MIGQILGHYRILEKIGEGGTGVVYRARDEQLDRDVALKVLPTGTLADEAARKRFRKEAVALAKLNHPNIETVHEFGSQDGMDFLVMEYIPGATLVERLAAGALPEKEVLSLGAHIAAALEEAHGQGVVHRDLKPGNIVVTPKGQGKVLDFGLAKFLRPESEISTTDVLSSRAAVAGTLPYMCPEQLRGDLADARSDIYAAGAVLYEMATGSRPFQEKVATALADDILHKPPPPPGRLKHDLSPRLEEIILKCLEKNPEMRYQSAKELGVDLRRLTTLASGATAIAARATPSVWRKAAMPAGYSVAALLLITALLLGFNVAGWRERLLGRAASRRIDSLAVLPLTNLSSDPEQEYFADGVTEMLITDLSEIGALKVISRTSVMHYKGERKPLPEIARELNVDAVVEGTVQRSGDRVRVTAQLIHASTDRHLWAKSYERELKDILVLESEVARAIAEEIRVKLTPQEQLRLARTRQVNPAAHEAYLRGRFFWNKRTAEGFERAVEYFKEAIEKDPGYARAYSGLADAYTLLWNYGLLAPKEAYPKARATALKALELDETLAEAHTSLAGIMADYEWDWRGAEREYKRAIELNPNYETAHQWYSSLLSELGRNDEAIAEAIRARELAPLSLRINADAGYAYYWARRYQEAIEAYRKTLELDPNFVPAHTLLGWAYTQMNRNEEAIQELRNTAALSEKGAANMAALAYAYAAAGQRSSAEKIREELEERFNRKFVPAYDLAIIYAGLRETPRALERLEKAYAEVDKRLGYLQVDPTWDALRTSPRFQVLLRRMNFPK